MLIMWDAKQTVSSYSGMSAALGTHPVATIVWQVLQYAAEILCLKLLTAWVPSKPR